MVGIDRVNLDSLKETADEKLSSLGFVVEIINSSVRVVLVATKDMDAFILETDDDIDKVVEMYEVS